MNLRRVLRVCLRFLFAAVLILGLLIGAGWLYLHPSFQQTAGIVYGKRHGHALTFDVVRPAKPNGLGVAFMVSGGWKSGTNAFHPWMAAPLLRRGYTVFPVCHVSQP